MNVSNLLRNPEIKSAFICGLIIWVVASIPCFATPLAPLLIAFLFLVPGLAFCVYGLYLKHSKQEPFIFMLIGGALYCFCFYITDLKHDSQFIPTLFLSSSIGSTGLFVLYYLLVSNDYIFVKAFLYALFNGVICACPPSLFFHLMDVSNSPWALVGVFSIYFFWQLGFTLVILTNRKKAIEYERS